MNSRTIKNKKRDPITARSIAFWSVIGVIVLTLLVLLFIKVFQLKDVNEYNLKNDSVVGSEIFTQKEDTYFVLFYNFSNSEEMETFDNTMYQYLTFYRDNKLKAGVHKVYFAVSTNAINKKCVGSKSVITNTTKFPNTVQQTGDDTLQISESELPVLLIVENGKITSYKAGETNILSYLDEIKNSK